MLFNDCHPKLIRRYALAVYVLPFRCLKIDVVGLALNARVGVHLPLASSEAELLLALALDLLANDFVGDGSTTLA